MVEILRGRSHDARSNTLSTVSGDLRVRLEGPTAALGEIAASDFARVLLGTQSALQRAAGHVIGRHARDTGRPGKVIEDSTRLRLVAIEPGSVIAVLASPSAPEGPEVLKLSDSELGERAIEAALDTLEDLDPEYPDVADAFVRMADDVGLGRRFDVICFERHGSNGHRTFRLDVEVRERLKRVARQPASSREETLVGVLVEADFEALTARLRGAGGAKASVTFSEDLAEDVKWALRDSARLRGEVRYDATSAEVRSIDLQRIDTGDQLVLGLDPGDFWCDETVEQLAREREIVAVGDSALLRADGISDDEVDRLMAALEGM